MPKLILTMLLCIAAFCVNAQTTVCHKDSVPVTHSYDVTDTGYYKVYEIVGSKDSIIYKTQCGKPCQLGLKGHRPHQVIDKIIQIPIYDSVQHPTYTTVTITERYDSFFLKCDTIPVKTMWGLKIQNDKFTNQLNVAQQLGIAAIRPNSIGVMNWDGNLGNVVDWKLKGYFPVLNILWNDNPNEKPYAFVKGADTVKFKTNFEAICIALKKAIYPNTPLLEKPKNDSLIAIMENEPANQKYYNWDSAAYIHELQMAIVIAHKYGLKIADGCTHLEYIEMIRNGTWKQQDGAIRNKQILDAFKQKKVVPDYGDFHCAYEVDRKSGAYPVPDLNTTISYYRDYTGLIAICNEYHMTGATASQINGVWVSPQVNYFTSGYKAAGVPIVVAWSGDNIKSDAYNLGITITPIGLAYQRAIK